MKIVLLGGREGMSYQCVCTKVCKNKIPIVSTYRSKETQFQKEISKIVQYFKAYPHYGLISNQIKSSL